MAAASSARREPVLCDRRDECAVLDRLVEGARVGRSGVLVLKGDAGIGKTALLEYAVGSVSDMRGVRTAGVESEMELAFAALHQLCAPLLEWLERLPGPQRHALATAFGLSEGAMPDRFFVALAVLGLLSEAAEERPLVCLVDDIQWLDRASAQVLAFVARRLLAEPVVMLFGAREPSEEFAGLPELVIEGLEGADAQALLASVFPGRLDALVADQIVAETRGNPLALLELPRGLSAAELAGGFGLPGAVSLEGRIEESFRQRLGALPDDTRRLFLVAAAEPLGDPALLRRAAAILGLTDQAVEPARRAALIEIDGRVRFRHPLVRSAVYGASSPPERREAHRALGEATDAQVDPDRRAWHLAKAAAGPDECVAAELEHAAGRAQARGGVAAAAAFLERAAALTPEPSSRARRALAAAQAKFEAGALEDALALLATADKGPSDQLRHARIHLLRAQIAFASTRGSDAPPLLLEAAREFEPVDPSLSRATYLDAFAAALFAGRLAAGRGVVAVADAVRAGPPPPPSPRPSELLLHGLAVRFTEGYVVGAPTLREALSAFGRNTALPAEDARWLWLACWVASDLWDDKAWTLLSGRQLELARDAGALTALTLALSARVAFLGTSGDVSAVESMAGELRLIADATGIATSPYGALLLAALRGREAEASRLIKMVVGEAVTRGEGFAVAAAEQLSGLLYNGLGRYNAALAAVRDAGEHISDFGAPTLGVAELIESAVRSGEVELAGRALERLEETTCASGTEWALGVRARSGALLSEGDRAERLYREGIERLQRTLVPLELARAHLLYGEWLRRERRRRNAREQLRIALEMFTGMGTEAFVGRAERELRATGERVRKRSVDTTSELTTQEAQVARLARDGLSNVEIGARLFISQHTVAYHLRKVFTKLGVTSRNQLGRVLPESASAGQVA
ncbi:MAG TPA: AAA family ATPase [Solirubrobacteraceae bacterium]|nr:AAA family ATPase [Solirubrobacteraceae bacterium]